MDILSSEFKEVIEKEQHVCKLQICMYISNIPRGENSYYSKFSSFSKFKLG